MRVEPAPYVFRNDDRRQRFEDRRSAAEDRRTEQPAKPRARHAAHVWFAPAFGAQILGQIAPESVIPVCARRAYAQPEARTPLRPSLVKSA
jgi:hypothetical protein